MIERKISNSSTSESLLIFALMVAPVIIIFSVLRFNDWEPFQIGTRYTYDELMLFLTLLPSVYISVLSESQEDSVLYLIRRNIYVYVM